MKTDPILLCDMNPKNSASKDHYALRLLSTSIFAGKAQATTVRSTLIYCFLLQDQEQHGQMGKEELFRRPLECPAPLNTLLLRTTTHCRQLRTVAAVHKHAPGQGARDHSQRHLTHAGPLPAMHP